MLIAICVTAAASSCGIGTEAAQQAGATAMDQSRWYLPLNDYHGPAPDLVNRATNVLLRPCLEAAGFELPGAAPAAPAGPGDAPLIENDVGRRLFAVAAARLHGYHFDPPTSSPTMTAAQAAALDTPAGRAAADECTARLDRDLPVAPPADLLVALEFAAYESAASSDGVLEAAGRWQACMAPAGVADLPATPEGMPSESLVERFGLGDPPTAHATDEEIDMAVTDAGCRDAAGFDAALYQREWQNQVDSLDANRRALERLRRDNAHYRDLLEAITASAP